MPRTWRDQHRWNFWDSYATDDEMYEHDLRHGRLRLFRSARSRDLANISNILAPGTVGNHEETVKIERWYARADHDISREVLSRTVVTLLMGDHWMRDIPMDHLFDGATLETRGVKVDLVLPIRQYIAVEVIPAPIKNAETGRIWVHLEVVPWKDRFYQ